MAFRRLKEMIDIGRLRGLAPILAVSGIVLVFTNALLFAVFGGAPRAFAPGESYIEWRYYERAADTVAALRKITGPFMVYTGMSSALEGIDPRVLASGDSCRAMPVGICATGASMSRLYELQMPLLRSGLHPSLLVICLHPSWLAAEFAEVPPESFNPLPLARGRNWRAAGRTLSWWNWISKNRYWVNQVVFKLLFAARVRLDTTAVTDPSQPPERVGFSDRDTERQDAQTLAKFQGYGWFDAGRYRREEQAQADELGAMIRAYQARGTEVRIVLMPEGSALRARIPQQPRQFLLAYFDREFHTPPLPILDFEAAMPDSGFIDEIHMNNTGRAAFSAQLARALQLCARLRPVP
jgi:hypothetical protein